MKIFHICNSIYYHTNPHMINWALWIKYFIVIAGAGNSSSTIAVTHRICEKGSLWIWAVSIFEYFFDCHSFLFHRKTFFCYSRVKSCYQIQILNLLLCECKCKRKRMYSVELDLKCIHKRNDEHKIFPSDIIASKFICGVILLKKPVYNCRST